MSGSNGDVAGKGCMERAIGPYNYIVILISMILTI